MTIIDGELFTDHCEMGSFKSIIINQPSVCVVLCVKVVVLSPLLVGESAASIAATGIKLLVDCLASTSSDTTRVLVADCIGRLGHTRAGIQYVPAFNDCWDSKRMVQPTPVKS